MVDSKRNKRNGDIFIKRVGQFKYLGSALTEVGKCQTEIRIVVGIKKILNLSKVLRHRNISLETTKSLLNFLCHIDAHIW